MEFFANLSDTHGSVLCIYLTINKEIAIHGLLDKKKNKTHFNHCHQRIDEEGIFKNSLIVPNFGKVL